MIHSTHRFHGRNALRFAYQKGTSVRSNLPLSLRVAFNPRSSTWRAAVVVSRKVSKSAVVRNRIRRRLFEIVRHEGKQLAPHSDLVFSVYGPELATISHEELQQAVRSLLQKVSIQRHNRADHDILEAKEKAR